MRSIVLKSRLRKKFEILLHKELAVLVEAFPEIVDAHVNDVNKDVDEAAIRTSRETAPFLKTRCGRRDLDPGLELGRLQS